ncbi:hypothetical protein D3C72_2199920 [compost metagenome]
MARLAPEATPVVKASKSGCGIEVWPLNVAVTVFFASVRSHSVRRIWKAFGVDLPPFFSTELVTLSICTV